MSRVNPSNWNMFSAAQPAFGSQRVAPGGSPPPASRAGRTPAVPAKEGVQAKYNFSQIIAFGAKLDGSVRTAASVYGQHLRQRTGFPNRLGHNVGRPIGASP